MIKCVVFDIDNTIYDYDLCHMAAMEELTVYVCREYGIPESVFKEAFGKAKHRVKAQLGNTGAAHNRMLYMQLFLEEIGERPVSKALELYERYWNVLLGRMTLFPYVEPLMNGLRNRNIKIAVLTDLTAHIQHRKIRQLRLDEFVDYLVTSEEVGEEKPSKRTFIRLFEKVNSEPDEMLMIGDSQEKDISGALSVGMQGILFTRDLSNTMNYKCLEYIDGQMD